jgi:lipid II:glycine glycyltransferase (peptidoglycan interpeptide bridge formation enzyme)
LDRRWDDLVACHPRTSIFHQREWLEALNRTFGYEPFVLTNTPTGKLRNGIVFCRISSWVTGVRAVSLPFTDHCEPLLNEEDGDPALMECLQAERERQHFKYMEIRPLPGCRKSSFGLQPSHTYCFHELDITPSLEQIFARMHKDSVQRRIRHAEKEHLSYGRGCSEEMLDAFFSLLVITRKRHRLPPPPRSWFSNLVQYMGDKIEVRLVRKNDLPIAAMITLRHKSTVVYKYGASDHKFHNIGAMPFLFWKLIEESKSSRAEKIDFGRSDLDDNGLIAFKDKFGTTKRRLTYYRYPGKQSVFKGTERAARCFFSFIPSTLSPAVGKMLYRHIG